MFSVSERTRIRQELIDRAREDDRIIGAALVGSAARNAEDEWSDIDLALQLHPTADEAAVVDDWTRMIDEEWGVADTFDLVRPAARYRVFLLTSSLQLDVSFWPHDRFRATEPAFRLLFGTPNAPTESRPPDAADTIGWAWLYAIHARSAVGRGRLWQAQMMLDELRDSLVALSCLRFGLDPSHGREVDRLPESERAALADGRAARVSPDELERSRNLYTLRLLEEIERHDPARAERLRAAFGELAAPIR